MFNSEGLFTLKQRYEFFHHVRRCGIWYETNQNTEEHPWGGINESADLGRFVYEFKLPKFIARGNGIWGQATAIMGLLGLNKRTGEGHYLNSAILAGNYLMSLQWLDQRVPGSVGGFRESNPQTLWSYPRDAATGAFGLCALYQYTKDEEYLYRAKLFADWWLKHGTDKNKWPYISFDLKAGKGTNRTHASAGEEDTGAEHVAGDWQAGAGLFLYYLWKLTGDRNYVEEGLKPLIDRAIIFYDRNPISALKEGFHGQVEVSYGNDDFALSALLAGYMAFNEKKYLDTAVSRIKGLLSIMDADGSFPSLGGTYVCGINMANLVEMNEALNLKLDLKDVLQALKKTAIYGLSVQETTNIDPRLFGGVYGQCDFDASRDWIHQRSTSYSMALYLRLEGKIDVPYFHCLHW